MACLRCLVLRYPSAVIAADGLPPCSPAGVCFADSAAFATLLLLRHTEAVPVYGYLFHERRP